jgi:hypothetical protein
MQRAEDRASRSTGEIKNQVQVLYEKSEGKRLYGKPGR